MAKFNNIYENIHRECKEPLERMRKEAVSSIITTISITVIIGIIFALMINQPYLIIVSIIVAILLCTFSGKRKLYNKQFKEKVIGTFVKEYDENLTYAQHRGVHPSVYVLGEFESFDRYSAEDSISGILKEHYRINMSEVHTERESRDEDGHRSYHTVFRGLFAEVESDKFLTDKIKIRKNAIKLFDSKQRIEMDSGEFEKIYDIYSENKIVAMQLLTADIMQMFIDFKEKNKIVPELTIKGNKLYIRFQTGNTFEANIFKDALDYSTLLKYYNTIEFTLGITEKTLKNISETEI